MSKEGRGFFLFTAINGLFERARSSAEKESQRLFTGEAAAPSTGALGDSRKRKSAPLADSLAKTKNRPKPPQKRRVTSRASPPPPRASSVMSDRTRLAATVDTLALEEAEVLPPVEESAVPVPIFAKRKREGGALSTTSSPKKPRASDASLASELAPNIHISSSRSSSTMVSSALTTDLTKLAGFSAPVLTPANSEDLTPTTSSNPASRPLAKTAASSSGLPAVVERERLEKVERELHRLKKIIASLLPDELNDDDLRSVYGDLERPRHVSDDAIARLVKARFGQLPTPTSAPESSIPQAPPLPPPPLPQSARELSSAHKSAVTAAAAAARGRSLLGPRVTRIGGSAAQPLRHGSADSSSAASASATASKPREDLLRPAANKPKPKPTPPPHKDPGVMSKLLEEMRHHKLRPVKKKPRDM